MLYICTFVYAITFFLLFDLHKVLTVKNNRKKRQKNKRRK